MKRNYQKIKELISENKVESALSNLNIFKTVDNKTQIIMLESRFNQLKQFAINGIINEEKYNLELNKIRFSILQLADLLVVESNKFIDTQFSEVPKLSIKKVEAKHKVNLKFRRESKGETYDIEVNANTEIGELAHQIIISFEPDYESNFLFRENRIYTYVKKILRQDEYDYLDNDKTIKESNLVNGDTIIIKFGLRVLRNTFSAT